MAKFNPELIVLQYINDNPACVRGHIVSNTDLDRDEVGIIVARLRAAGYIHEPMFSIERAGELTIEDKGKEYLATL